MAIGNSITKFGVSLANAYHRIEWMNLNLLNGSNSLEVQVSSYTEKDGELIERRSFVLPVDKANASLKYAYTELAKLPEFADGAEV
jgi:hypothetical protein